MRLLADLVVVSDLTKRLCLVLFVCLFRARDHRRSGPRVAPARRRSLLAAQAAGAPHQELQGRPQNQVRRRARLPRRGLSCFVVPCCRKWSRCDDQKAPPSRTRRWRQNGGSRMGDVKCFEEPPPPPPLLDRLVWLGLA